MDIKRNNLDLNDIAYQRSGWTAPRFCDRIMQGGEMIWEAMCGLTSTVKQTIYADYPDNPSLAATIWTALKAYARSHTALVSYINNDPDLYCSLPLDGVTGRKVRWLVSTGNRHIDLGIKPTATTVFEVKMKLADGVTLSSCGSRVAYGNSASTIHLYTTGNQFNVGNQTITTTEKAVAGMPYVMKIDGANKKVYVDSSSYDFTSNIGCNYNLWIGANNNAGTEHNSNACAYVYAQVDSHTFVPYQPPTAGASAELLDLETATLATRSGAFTVEKTAS